MAQPLPTALPESFSPSKIHFKLAYSRILELEQDALSDTNPKNCEQKLVCARILGYLIWEGLSMHVNASEHVVEKVDSCQDYDQLYKLGEMYLCHYICIIKNYEIPTSSPASPLLYPSFKTKKELLKELVKYMLHNSGELFQKNKSQALVRDGFQCIVTGYYDFQSVGHCPELEQEVANTPSGSVVCSECAHILPNMNSDDKAKHEYATSFWTITKGFYHEGLLKKLIGDNIHALDNIMTLGHDIHIMFDILLLWFEALDDQENTYAIKAQRGYYLCKCKANPITMASHYSNLPLPNPTYLRIHAACCRVVHLSGATEYIMKKRAEEQQSP